LATRFSPLELKLIDQFPHQIIATDEVGRGPLSGPVVIGAIRVEVEQREALSSLLKFLRSQGITDSKLMTPERRRLVLAKLGVPESLPFRRPGTLELKGIKVSFVTWEMDHAVIDQENILAASLRGMKEAALFLAEEKFLSTTVLIDGKLKLRWGNLSAPWNEIPLIKGDSRSLLIGLASIIAKEKRDAHMKEMHELYPQYGFAAHFGYPTKAHRLAIQTHGPSPIHRKSFKGVREFVGAQAGAGALT
jgi:ribonuclease HII